MIDKTDMPRADVPPLERTSEFAQVLASRRVAFVGGEQIEGKVMCVRATRGSALLFGPSDRDAASLPARRRC